MSELINDVHVFVKCKKKKTRTNRVWFMILFMKILNQIFGNMHCKIFHKISTLGRHT